MCEVLSVSRSGYYAWRDRPKSQRGKANEKLLSLIQEVYGQSHKNYGSPRVHKALQKRGLSCGRNRVARLMREYKIIAKRQIRYKRSTSTAHGRSIAKNLLDQQFIVKKPNVVWASDITCFWTGSGWLYLSVVMDLYSRRIIGWAMHRRMTDQLAIDALEMAFIHRQPSKGLLHHSDQGSQYASENFRNRLQINKIQCSMSRKGNCYDNAVVESFFKTLKIEWTYDKKYKTREEAKASLFEFIEIFYNQHRLHSTLGYLSPVDFERKTVS